MKRQKKLKEFKAKGIKGTPVTPETFKAWQDRKRKRKADAARKKVEAELRKKKGGKGLSVLSGRDLFEYKKELFKDDEAAANDIDNMSTVAEETTEEKKDEITKVAAKVESDLFLGEDDDDLDDLDDLDDD